MNQFINQTVSWTTNILIPSTFNQQFMGCDKSSNNNYIKIVTAILDAARENGWKWKNYNRRTVSTLQPTLHITYNFAKLSRQS
jgi:hypothetical protein